MGDPPRSPTPDFYNILGISKGASILDVCKAYKSLVKKWHPDKNPSNKSEAEVKFQSINEAYEALNKKEEKNKVGDEDSITPKGSNFNRSIDDGFFQLPSFLSRSLSRRSQTPTKSQTPTSSGGSLSKISSRRSSISTEFLHSPSTPTPSRSSSTPTDFPSPTTSDRRCTTPTPTPTSLSKSASRGRGSTTPSSLSKSTSRRCTTPNSLSNSASRRSNSVSTVPDFSASLSKSASRRSPTPIIYSHSQSTIRRKPPPIEMKLECTLEELCHGCTKKIKITRDAISHVGLIVQEEEVLKIEVKPGWKKGMSVKFEGKGDERPGTLPADIIFLIEEKRHPIFKREGDNLEIGVEIPLVRALTGCPLSVPLLGGEKMSLFIDDIIYHGYEKIIPGQGMPIAKQEGRRGDLMIKFLVSFPTELTDRQRSNVYKILKDSS